MDVSVFILNGAFCNDVTEGGFPWTGSYFVPGDVKYSKLHISNQQSLVLCRSMPDAFGPRFSTAEMFYFITLDSNCSIINL